MYIRENSLLLMCLLLISFKGYSQEIINFYNPSFEDEPRHSKTVKGWNDCGFINESPPDVQPGSWDVTLKAHDGKTYLGMVTRDNDTWERVSQRLPRSIQGDKCYTVSVYLAAFDQYISASKLTGQLSNYNKPTVLRIWGGNGVCDNAQLLAESTPVQHSTWKKYTFKLEPDADYQYIILEAFYDVPVLIPTNGNLLVDKLSPLQEIPCDESLIAVSHRESTPEPVESTPSQENHEREMDKVVQVDPMSVKKEPKIIKELKHDNLKEGQFIKIENLYFKTDSTSITAESRPVLKEIYDFLSNHKDVKIEVGGHTNGLPPESYCNKLSQERAKAVVDYLVEMGIDKSRISYKGYGKEKPIASDETKAGREQNQRCEIKIVSIEN